LPTRIQTTTWRWRHLSWDERERILASVWIWYHTTHGDRTYNRHMRRDWTNHGRVSPTAKYVNGRWHQLGNGDGLYQPLRERLEPYQADITELVDTNQPLDAHPTATA
jgi:hypothetical protein